MRVYIFIHIYYNHFFGLFLIDEVSYFSSISFRFNLRKLLLISINMNASDQLFELSNDFLTTSIIILASSFFHASIFIRQKN